MDMEKRRRIKATVKAITHIALGSRLVGEHVE
jgi:hypothetical protein